jgi:hypothetical protein
MNNRTLFTLGTPLGGWTALADYLRRSAPEGVDLAVPGFCAWHEDALGDTGVSPRLAGNVLDSSYVPVYLRRAAETLCAEQSGVDFWGGIDARAWSSIEFWAKQCPDAQFLIFFERPEQTLARETSSSDGTDPEAVLAVWRQGAERILHAVRRHRSRILLIDGEEASVHPERLVALCAQRYGVPFSSGSHHPAGEPVDTVSLTLALDAVRSNKQLSALCAELYVSCAPLSTDDGAEHANAVAVHAEPLSALVQYHALRQRTDALSADMRNLSAVLSQAENAQAAAAQRVAALEAERDRLRQQAEEASKEGELVLLQLHQVQEELEQYFLENQKLKNDLQANRPKPKFQSLVIGGVHVGTARDEGPYRHVNFRLRNVMQSQRRLDALDVRLVEHHGVPGLVLFVEPRGETVPLSCWQESGNEGGRVFMLLHPQHKASRAILARASASDWTLINHLVLLMQSALREDAGVRPVQASRWGLVCQRLGEQLAELPPALRYDAVHTAAVPAEAGATQFDIHLTNVIFLQRAYPNLRLRWQISGGHRLRTDQPSALVLVAGDGQSQLPPLARWPNTAAGSLQPELTLRFGKALASADRKTQWRALDRHDRDFVTALVRALPAALAEGLQHANSARPEPSDLVDLADRMAREINDQRTRVDILWGGWRKSMASRHAANG